MDSDHLQDLIAFIHVQCTLCTFRDDYEHSSDEFSKSLQIGGGHFQSKCFHCRFFLAFLIILIGLLTII